MLRNIVKSITTFGFGMVGSLVAQGLPSATRAMMKESGIRWLVLVGILSFGLLNTNSFAIETVVILFLGYNLLVKQTPGMFYANITLAFLIFAMSLTPTFPDWVLITMTTALFLSLGFGVYLDIQTAKIDHKDNFSYLTYFSSVEKRGSK